MTKQKETKEIDLTQVRDNRTIPLAKEVFRILAKHLDKGLLGSNGDSAEFNKSYRDAAKEIIEYLLENKCRISDVEYIRQLLLQPIDFGYGLASDSIMMSKDAAITKLFNKEPEQVTCEDIDKVLKEDKKG